MGNGVHPPPRFANPHPGLQIHRGIPKALDHHLGRRWFSHHPIQFQTDFGDQLFCLLYIRVICDADGNSYPDLFIDGGVVYNVAGHNHIVWNDDDEVIRGPNLGGPKSYMQHISPRR